MPASDSTGLPVIRTYLSALVVFFLLRLGFLAWHAALFRGAAGTELARAFLGGAVIDSSVTACTLLAAWLIALAALAAGRTAARRVFLGLCAILFGLYFFINLADIAYFDMFDSRLNVLVFENLDQMAPILQTIASGWSVVIVTIVWLAVLTAFILALRARSRVGGYSRRGARRVISGITVGLLLAALTFLWVGEPFWRLGLFSSGNQALTQLSLNGVYTLLKAYHQKRIWERDFGDIDYAFGPPEEALQRVRREIIGDDEAASEGRFPFARELRRPAPLAVAKPNIVIILMEGFTASGVGALCPGGIGDSPGFDRLAHEGILFTNFYGAGTRTHHGLVSTVASFPSLLELFLTRRRGTESFSTLGTLLRAYGYRTSFFYGYDAGFDHMGFFMRQGGFDLIVDQRDFAAPRFVGKWGVSDEDLFAKVSAYLSGQAEGEPVLSVVMTSSNHTPHDIPPEFAAARPQYAGDRARAAFAYSDYALARFLDGERDKPYFRRTIFVIVADHGEIRDRADRYFKRFQIPCLLYAPGLIPGGRTVSTVGSQADIATTLMHLIGYPRPFHFLGRDLLALPEDRGFAVMR
ncbi:MAG TPA: LTA synthase family protein, partial [candidate division Zixibacteria bacterium]|nr:LTA synthase family protein [candidate division Zixibacteria bacterium]